MNTIAKLLLNGLYGRFGMNDCFIYSEIYSKKDYPKFEKMEDFKESIQDLIDLGDNYLVQLKNPKVEQKTNLDNGFETHNVNIAIAVAVTAYARIHMSQFKNNLLLPNLYYTDTDSAYFDGPLPDHMVDSTRLGALKLEGIWDEAVFLSPKVYALRKDSSPPHAHYSNKNKDKLLIKVKGVKEETVIKELTFEVLENLLTENNSEKLNQVK